MQVEVRHGSATDVGRVRTQNQDDLAVEPPVFVVADGMGGHDGGEVASAIVVEELRALGGRSWTPTTGTQAVVDALTRGRARIARYVESQGRDRHAGTTVVVALLAAEDDGTPCWVLAHVGDSRIYSWGPDGLALLTRDHSVVQELLDAGMIEPREVSSHPERHVITRALSAQESPEPDVATVPVVTAGRLLLCSDGVNGMLSDEEIADLLAAHADPAEAATAVVRAAVQAGGEDNATAVVVDVVGWDAEQVGRS